MAILWFRYNWTVSSAYHKVEPKSNLGSGCAAGLKETWLWLDIAKVITLGFHL